MRKAASRPNATATRPPRAAPQASIVPHAEPRRTLATGRSDSSTRFGRAADEVGSKNAESAEMAAVASRAIQSIDGSRTSRKVSAAPARNTSAVTIRRRRSSRSASTPAIGEAKKNGADCSTSTSDARAAEPVSSSARPSKATVANQSPPKLMSCAM